MIVHVRNFGKIESADIDISSFSIFVGENNSGKTYLMQLIYGIISCFFYERDFQNYLSIFQGIHVGNGTLLNADDRDFLVNFETYINQYLNDNKEIIVEKTFHTRSLAIESLFIELEGLKNSYSIRLNDFSTEETGNPKNFKRGEIFSENRKRLGAFFATQDSETINQFFMRELLKIILSDIIGVFVDEQISSYMLYLPASRSGIMLLYANYLANEKERTIDDEIIVNSTPEKALENEYGLTEPIYNFLMFLLKNKDSEIISDKKQQILSFINENIINGSLEKVGSSLRYTPSASGSSIPIYLSSSLVSELAPICQVLSGNNHISFILYDEIETCQHPTKQLQLARLLVRMVNEGYKMIVSTHSDTMAAAINNLITLSAKKDKLKIAEELGYCEDDLLKDQNVHVYQFIVDENTGKTNVSELRSHLSLGIGFDFSLFNRANDKIYQDALKLAEVD